MNIFDFDGTLYDGDSTIDFWKYSLWRFPKCISALPNQMKSFFLHKVGKLSLEEFKEAFYKFLFYIPDVDQAVQDFWHCHKSKIKDLVFACANAGDIIVSASPRFILDPISSELGLSLVASDVDKTTGKLLGPNCKGEEKVNILRQEGWPMHYENAYSDTLSDLPILHLADNAFIVKGESITPLAERE